MGPNGSGKSTFAKVLAGHPAYAGDGGPRSATKGSDLLALAPEARARAGIFLAFPVSDRDPRRRQQPVPAPGLQHRAGRSAARTSSIRSSSTTCVREKMKLLEMNPEFLDRSVNEGFSGGEKKRNEILQMALLEPTLAILDETDSGLDIDALRVVVQGREPARRRGQRRSCW